MQEVVFLNSLQKTFLPQRAQIVRCNSRVSIKPVRNPFWTSSPLVVQDLLRGSEFLWWMESAGLQEFDAKISLNDIHTLHVVEYDYY
jgi:hypothetical protein